MAPTKISSQVDEAVWRDLQDLAKESHQSISGLLTEAIKDYVRRKRISTEVMDNLTASISVNEELGRKLAE